jgi:hypothetical protein
LTLSSLAEAVASVVRKAMRTGATDCGCGRNGRVTFALACRALNSVRDITSDDARAPPSRSPSSSEVLTRPPPL